MSKLYIINMTFIVNRVLKKYTILQTVRNYSYIIIRYLKLHYNLFEITIALNNVYSRQLDIKLIRFRYLEYTNNNFYYGKNRKLCNTFSILIVIVCIRSQYL
jgi:hypothetical protein